MNTIRVAIIGVGNCASSLIQGVPYSRDAKETGFAPDPAHRHRGPRTDRYIHPQVPEERPRCP